MNIYKVLVEFELEGVKQEVGEEIEMEAELGAPLVDAGNLEVVTLGKTEEELAAEAQIKADEEAKATADATAAEEAAAAEKAEAEKKAAEEAAAQEGGEKKTEKIGVEVLDGDGKVKQTFTAQKNGPDFMELAKKFAVSNGWTISYL